MESGEHLNRREWIPGRFQVDRFETVEIMNLVHALGQQEDRELSNDLIDDLIDLAKRDLDRALPTVRALAGSSSSDCRYAAGCLIGTTAQAYYQRYSTIHAGLIEMWVDLICDKGPSNAGEVAQFGLDDGIREGWIDRQSLQTFVSVTIDRLNGMPPGNEWPNDP